MKQTSITLTLVTLFVVGTLATQEELEDYSWTDPLPPPSVQALYRHFGKRANSFYVPQVNNAARSEACSMRAIAALVPSSVNIKRLAKRKIMKETDSVIPPLTQALRNLERRILHCDRINHADQVRLV